jgi:hypothetical protein
MPIVPTESSGGIHNTGKVFNITPSEKDGVYQSWYDEMPVYSYNEAAMIIGEQPIKDAYQYVNSYFSGMINQKPQLVLWNGEETELGTLADGEFTGDDPSATQGTSGGQPKPRTAADVSGFRERVLPYAQGQVGLFPQQPLLAHTKQRDRAQSSQQQSNSNNSLLPLARLLQQLQSLQQGQIPTTLPGPNTSALDRGEEQQGDTFLTGEAQAGWDNIDVNAARARLQERQQDAFTAMNLVAEILAQGANDMRNEMRAEQQNARDHPANRTGEENFTATANTSLAARAATNIIQAMGLANELKDKRLNNAQAAGASEETRQKKTEQKSPGSGTETNGARRERPLPTNTGNAQRVGTNAALREGPATAQAQNAGASRRPSTPTTSAEATNRPMERAESDSAETHTSSEGVNDEKAKKLSTEFFHLLFTSLFPESENKNVSAVSDYSTSVEKPPKITREEAISKWFTIALDTVQPLPDPRQTRQNSGSFNFADALATWAVIMNPSNVNSTNGSTASSTNEPYELNLSEW